MDLANDFTVESIIKIPSKGGITVLGDLKAADHGFQIGSTVKIIRSDGTAIISLVREIELFHVGCCPEHFGCIGLLLGETITKEDVPPGSIVSIAE